MRMGRWRHGSVVEAYVGHVPVEGLLVLAGYDCNGVERLRTAFWARRFMALIPPPLMEACKLHVFTFLKDLRSRAALVTGVSGRGARVSVRNVLAAVEFITEAGIQDSLELADTAPNSFLVLALRSFPVWQELRQSYVVAVQNGVGCDVNRCSQVDPVVVTSTRGGCNLPINVPSQILTCLYRASFSAV